MERGVGDCGVPDGAAAARPGADRAVPGPWPGSARSGAAAGAALAAGAATSAAAGPAGMRSVTAAGAAAAAAGASAAAGAAGPGAAARPARPSGRGPPGAEAAGFASCDPMDSLSLRTTGASIVEDAERTNSPISWSWAMTALLSTPSSFASS
jgi:hypothetical protein